jgi:hypothetical protein
VFIKEADIKKLICRERKEVPISYAMTMIYLTNKRLVFLILYQVETRLLAERGAPSLSGVTGTWFEMPIFAITDVDIRPVLIRQDREMMRLVEWGIIPNLERATAVELIYDEKMATGRIKDYMEPMLKMGFSQNCLRRLNGFTISYSLLAKRWLLLRPC